MNRTIILKAVIVLFISVFAFGVENDILGNSRQKTSGGDQLRLMDYGLSVNGIYSMPSGSIVNAMNGALGGSITIMDHNVLYFLLPKLSIGLSGDYINYTCKAGSGNSFQTINSKILGKYDLSFNDIPGSFFVEGGGGVSFETLTLLGSEYYNIDPLFQIGIGYETGLNENFTIQVGINYMFVPESYISALSRDGAFINISLGINYEFQLGGGRRK